MNKSARILFCLILVAAVSFALIPQPAPSPETVLDLGDSPSHFNLTVSDMPMAIEVWASTRNGVMKMPSNTLNFVSDNPDIAIVNTAGMVTGKAPGKTKITTSYIARKNIKPLITEIEVEGTLGGKP